MVSDVFLGEFVSVWLCACGCRHPSRSKEGRRSCGTGVRGGWEPPNVGDGN